MKFLFVKSPKLGSKIIQWGLDQDVSHVVISFNGTHEEYFHSYGFGLYSMKRKEFEKFQYTVVHEIEFKLEPEKERLVQMLYYRYVKDMNIKYDYPAMIYFAWRAVLKKFFGRPLPMINELGQVSFNLCTEALYIASESYGMVTGQNIIPATIDLSMITPKDAFDEISKYKKDMNL